MIWTHGRDDILRQMLAAGATLERIAAVLRTDRDDVARRASTIGIAVHDGKPKWHRRVLAESTRR